MPFVLIGWLVAVPLAIWWPRRSGAESGRTRVYGLLRNAGSCLLLGYVLFALLFILGSGVDRHDDLFLILVVVLVFLGVLALTPLALGMLALDFRNRWLGLGSGVLATLFPAGIAVYEVLMLFGVGAGLIPFWYAFPALGALLFCGAATAFVLEAYAMLRVPSRKATSE